MGLLKNYYVDNTIGGVVMAFTNPQDAFDGMIANFNAEEAKGVEAVFQWDIVGDGGGIWHIAVKDEQATLNQGAHDAPNVSQTSSVELFLGMVNFEVNAMQAFMAGKLKVSGDMMLAQKIMSIFPL